MRKTLASVMVVAAILASSAVAAAPQGLTVKVKGKDVLITNKSSQAHTGFFINSTDAPKITGTSISSCKMGTSPWSSKGKHHVDYWANCHSMTVKAGATLDVKLTTSGGKGTIFVWAQSGKAQSKIGTGIGG